MPDLEQDASRDEKRIEQWWKDAPRWQKAGVLIAGGALLVAILMYWRSRTQGQSATDTSSTATPATAATGTYSPVESAGYGDIWPSLGSLPSTATYTTPGTSYATTGLTPLDLSSFSSTLPTDNSQQQWSSPGSTSADILASQQALANAIWGAPTAGTPSGLSLGEVSTAAPGSIWSQMLGNTNTGSSTAASSSTINPIITVPDVGTTIQPTTSLGSGWNVPATPTPPAPARPAPSQNSQQAVSSNLGKGSFKLPAGFHL